MPSFRWAEPGTFADGTTPSVDALIWVPVGGVALHFGGGNRLLPDLAPVTAFFLSC
jgi:hypothetical protein